MKMTTTIDSLSLVICMVLTMAWATTFRWSIWKLLGVSERPVLDNRYQVGLHVSVYLLGWLKNEATETSDALVRKTFVYVENPTIFRMCMAWKHKNVEKLRQDYFSLNSAQRTCFHVLLVVDISTHKSIQTWFLLYVDWVWEKRMSKYVPQFNNFIFDQIVTNKGSLNYCVRWDSKEKLTKTDAATFEDMLTRQFKAWNKWLIGYECWPYEEIDIKIVGWAARDAFLFDWTDDSLGTFYTDDKDDEGIPKCPDACYKHQDQSKSSDTSGCTGTPFDMSLWPTQNLDGGAGGDWGQRVDAGNMMASLDSEELVIVSHEIGHGFGLPDFKWLIGYECWPYEEIDIKIVGWAARDAFLFDWTDDSLGTFYTDDKDDEGIPKCPDACYKHQDQSKSSDTSGCTGTPFDMSLWPTQNLDGGAGGDWGQRVDAGNMMASLDSEELVIVSHEIGHGFGLPDFYETTEKPADDFPTCIMVAGSSMSVTPADGWMLRRVLENIKSRYSF